jgi:hypothetical protein
VGARVAEAAVEGEGRLEGVAEAAVEGECVSVALALAEAVVDWEALALALAAREAEAGADGEARAEALAAGLREAGKEERTSAGAPAEGSGKASADAAASATGADTVACTCAKKALAFTPVGSRQGSCATASAMLPRLEEFDRARLPSSAAAAARSAAGTVRLTLT